MTEAARTALVLPIHRHVTRPNTTSSMPRGQSLIGASRCIGDLGARALSRRKVMARLVRKAVKRWS